MSKSSGKPSLWQQAVGFLFFLGIGAACGYLIANYARAAVGTNPDASFPIVPMLLLLLCMYAAIFTQMVVHEAGHLVFGLLTGYGFSSFRIGSVMLLRQDGRLVFKRLSLAGTGGQCLMTPPEWRDGQIPFVLYNLGGSLMNLIFSALCALLAIPLRGVAWVSAVPWLFVITGVMIALMNGLPLRVGLVDNDGRNAVSMGKNPAALRAFWIQLKINAANAQGMRLKDMPDEWFALPPDADHANSMISTIDVLVCNRLLDAQHFDAAREQIDALLEREPPLAGLHRNLLVCDRLYLELIGPRSAERIDSLHTREQRKFMKAMRQLPSVLRTNYAYALLHERDADQAAALLTQFEKRATTYPYESDVCSERELIAFAQNLAS